MVFLKKTVSFKIKYDMLQCITKRQKVIVFFSMVEIALKTRKENSSMKIECLKSSNLQVIKYYTVEREK